METKAFVIETFKTSWITFLNADLLPASAAFALYIFSFFTIGLRWKLVIGGLGGQTSTIMTTLSNVAGIFINNVTPASRIGGEACRILLIRERGGVNTKTAALSSLYDRVSELPPVIFLFIFAFPSLKEIAINLEAYTLIGSLLVVLILAAILIYRSFQRLQSWIRDCRQRLSEIQIPKHVTIAALSLSTFVWFKDVLRIWCAALAFGVTLSASQASTLSVLAIFGGLVPTIGGLGAIEGSMLAGLVLFGIPLEKAIAIIALERAISYAFGTLCGAASLTTLGGWKLWKSTK